MSSAYWCHRCNRFVRVWNRESIDCPDCNTGFVEEVDTPTPPSLSGSRRLLFPFPSMYTMNSPEPCPFWGPGSGSSPGLRRSRRNGGDRSPFNPVIVLRRPNAAGGGFELFYDDEAGLGLLPLPPTVSEFLLGSGFDRLLIQLSQTQVNWSGRADNNLPAPKAAIDSMPTIEIIDHHVSVESHCAVCKEAFEMGNEAREMPCNHLFHQDCILPWLSLRNSCPVCRHELMSDNESHGCSRDVNEANRGVGADGEVVGLTIWRLPGGGYAVGRFSSGRRPGVRELPVVYTEMDGGFNNIGMPRRISWGSRDGISRNRGGLRRVLNGVFSCFGRSGASRIGGRSGSLSSSFSES